MNTRVPFNDLSRHVAADGDRLADVVTRVVASGWYLLGPETEAFEAAFAAYCGAASCVAVANGTDALEIALRTVGCGPEHEVILTANAGNYATTACLAIGAVPVYAEVEPTTLLIDPASVRRLVGPATRAVVATHLYGNVVDVATLREVIPDGIAIVEDCAQAHGASSGGRRVGSLGDAAAFSFYPTKNLGALGDAGAVVTSADRVERARQLRQYGWTERYHATVPGGCNSRMDELQAAVLRSELPGLERRNQRRRAIRARYVEALGDRLAFVADAPGPVLTVAHLCVARSPERDALVEALAAQGVQAAVHYPIADHRQPALQSAPFRLDDLTETEAACAEVLSLPCFPELGDDEVDAVICAVERST